MKRTHSPGAWKIPAVAAALLAPFLVYIATARSIVSIWNSSETYAHGYVILPIALWLIWKRRATLSLDHARPFWPGLILLAACGFGWLLAELADVQVVRQYAFAAMIPLTVLTVLGRRLAWSMAFPLLFLMLAVPFGDAFINPLIEFTANFTVAALQLTGIPVLRNGNFFEIPSGNWSVVEACSGVRYLISSVTLGSLYAYLTYRSPMRRAAFILLSVIVPIIANGLRAYMIVMLGHLSGMTLAVGVDHIIYGWLFFGLVMFIMFWIGNMWREDRDEMPAQAANTAPAFAESSTLTGQVYAAAICSALCIGLWPIYANYIDRIGINRVPVSLTAFQSSWQESAPFTQWKPRFPAASAELYKFYRHDAQQVGLAILYYRSQTSDAKLISSSNKMVPEKGSTFRQVGGSVFSEVLAGRTLAIREAMIQGESGHFLVWYWYWINGAATVNDYAGKLLQAREKIMMHGDDGAAIMMFAPYTAKADEARSVLREYLNANLSTIEASLDGNRKP